MKLVLTERESDALRTHLGDDALASASIAVVEVPRAVLGSVASEASIRLADGVLARVLLRQLDDDVIAEARALPAGLRSLDAIHLATAITLRAEVSEFVAYDRRLLSAARDAGFTVFVPGAE